MLLHILGGLLFAAAAVTTFYVISGIITRNKIRETLKNNSENINDAIITQINNCTNEISIKDLYSNCEYTIQGDGISNEIYNGEVITI